MRPLCTLWLVCLCSLGLALTACGRPKPPPTAYDPALIDLVRDAEAEHQDREASRPAARPTAPQAESECTRDTSQCPVGWICWDSWFCRVGYDQCSAAGDKRCHKTCVDTADCPGEMPVCRDVTIFKGSERGTTERICVEHGA